MSDEHDTLEAAAEELEQNDWVDRVIRCWEDDFDPMDALMVKIDWVTESHVENDTRIIDEYEYDDHLRHVFDAINAMDDVHRSRSMKSGLHGYTVFVEAGADRFGGDF
jgi:glycerol-3-phosphate cytidylyltransferase-like family protein